MSVAPELVLVANARMPSQRAQSLQVAQVAGAFERAGARTTLLYARRRDTPEVADGSLWEYYGVRDACPRAVAVDCADWIDRVPRALQFWPARVQEITFARNAARRVRVDHAGARVLSREIETAHALRGREGVFLEVHRVPGGMARRSWLRAAAESAAGIVAISSGVRSDLLELGVPAGKLCVEHDAVDLERFARLPPRADARRSLGIPESATLVVYAGGLLPWKGVDLLVEAARRLPALAFLIAGGMDADVERLRALADGLANVRVEGFRAPEEVPALLAAADLGVVPNRSHPAISARYTSPLKVFEAMAAGLPLVVSDLPSLRDVLGPDEACFVAPDSVEELARGIDALAGNAALRAELGARLRARAGAHGWDERARRLLAWMEERA